MSERTIKKLMAEFSKIADLFKTRHDEFLKNNSIEDKTFYIKTKLEHDCVSFEVELNDMVDPEKILKAYIEAHLKMIESLREENGENRTWIH